MKYQIERIKAKDLLIFSLVFLFVLSIFLLIRGGQKNNIIFSDGQIKTEIKKIKITATIYPIYQLAKMVAGNRADVELIIPKDADPTTFVPVDEDLIKAGEANFIFAVGAGLDDWTSKLKGETRGELVVLAESFEVKKFSYKSVLDTNGENKGSVNFSSPYYWLSLNNSKEIAQIIARKISQFDLVNKEFYINNAYDFGFEIDGLKGQIRSDFLKMKNKKIITAGDVWGYFAEDLEFKIFGIIPEIYLNDYSDDFFANFGDFLSRNGVCCVFIDPILADSYTSMFEELSKREFGILDPFGMTVEGDYLDIMKYNISEFMKITAS